MKHLIFLVCLLGTSLTFAKDDGLGALAFRPKEGAIIGGAELDFVKFSYESGVEVTYLSKSVSFEYATRDDFSAKLTLTHFSNGELEYNGVTSDLETEGLTNPEVLFSNRFMDSEGSFFDLMYGMNFSLENSKGDNQFSGNHTVIVKGKYGVRFHEKISAAILGTVNYNLEETYESSGVEYKYDPRFDFMIDAIGQIAIAPNTFINLGIQFSKDGDEKNKDGSETTNTDPSFKYSLGISYTYMNQHYFSLTYYKAFVGDITYKQTGYTDQVTKDFEKRDLILAYNIMF